MLADRKTATKGPSLRVLAIAGMLGVIGNFALTQKLSTSVLVNPIRDQTFLNAMDAHRGVSDALRIVLLGDSRMWFGLKDDGAVSASLSDALGRPVVIDSYFATNGEFLHFRNAIPQILDRQPDLLLVQSSLPFKEKTRSARAKLNRDTLIEMAFFWSVNSQNNLRQRNTCGNVVMDADLAANGGLSNISATFTTDTKAYQQTRDILMAVKQAGIPVALIAAPEPRFGPLPLPADRGGIAPEIRPVATIPTKDYCDPIHVGTNGATIYTGAFVRALAQWLQSQ